MNITITIGPSQLDSPHIQKRVHVFRSGRLIADLDVTYKSDPQSITLCVPVVGDQSARIEIEVVAE